MDTKASDLDLNIHSEITIERVDLLVNPEIIEEILTFYNSNFTKSNHTREFKERIYNDPSRNTIVFVVKLAGKIVGMIESWNDLSNPDRKVLATLLTDSEQRGKGLARRMFEASEAVVSEDPTKKEWVVHFRESNKDKLIEYYTNLGFTNLRESGFYSNGEIKFEMVKPIKPKESKEV